MATCSFCGNDMVRGTGLMFIKKDGRILNFCSRKCEVNTLKLNRNMRQIKWTSEYRRLKSMGKEEKK